ncbi:MAG: hypothetical protein QXH95_02865 [Thermoplasmata archaeon]
MNNYENMPEIIPTDVDIAIDKETLKKLDSILRDLASVHKVEIVQKICHGYKKTAYILSPLLLNKAFRLQLDFFVDLSTRGFPNLISNEVLLHGRKPFKNFFIPSPEVEALFLFMRRIIKNDLCLRHIEKLRLLFDKDKNGVNQKFVDAFGKDLADKAICLIETGDLSFFHNNFKDFRQSLKKRSRKNTTLAYRIRYGFSQIRRAINRFLHPVGFTVVLLGPDGSGKSTIANLVLERVSGSFHGGRVQYLRPYLLPAMGRLKFWNPSEEITTNPQPHNHPEQNPFKSLIRFFYYLIDYVIGYPIKIYWQKVRKNIIIFDRYYYDYLVDLRRYQFNIPRWLPRFFLPFIPSPDITIYLDAEPDLLYKRKQELSLLELERQVKEFKKVVSQVPNTISVRVDKPVEEIVKEISHQILNMKSQQTKKIMSI